MRRTISFQIDVITVFREARPCEILGARRKTTRRTRRHVCWRASAPVSKAALCTISLRVTDHVTATRNRPAMRSVLTLVITLMSNSLTSAPTGRHGARESTKNPRHRLLVLLIACAEVHFVMRHSCRTEWMLGQIRMRFLVYQLYIFAPSPELVLVTKPSAYLRFYCGQ